MPAIGAKNQPKKNQSHALRLVVWTQYAQKIPNKKHNADIRRLTYLGSGYYSNEITR